MYYDNSYDSQRSYSGGSQNNSQGSQRNTQAGKNTPPVRVELTEREFNFLNSVYAHMINKGTDEDQQKAKKLQDKIMRYTREYNDDAGILKKRVCFFESEAASTISFLIRCMGQGG